MKADPSLGTLLDLNGETLIQELGYWIKIDAWSIEPSEMVPHGIRYSLSLHNKYGTRVLGYDNAHAVKPPGKFKFAGHRLTFDHKHRHSKDLGVPYGFSSVEQLLHDFFEDVDRILEEAKNP